MYLAPYLDARNEFECLCQIFTLNLGLLLYFVLNKRKTKNLSDFLNDTKSYFAQIKCKCNVSNQDKNRYIFAVLVEFI